MAASWTPHQLAWTASESYSKWALFCKSLVNFPIPAMFVFEAFESNEDWAVQIGKISRISKRLFYAICYIFQKSVNMSSYQLNSKNIGSVLLLRLYSGIKIISCRLLQWMARIDMYWNLKKLSHIFPVLMLYLQISTSKKLLRLVLHGKMCLISSSWLYSSTVCMGKCAN